MGDGQATSHHAIIRVLRAHEQEPWGHKAELMESYSSLRGWAREKLVSEQSEFQTERKGRHIHVWTGQNGGDCKRLCAAGFLGDEAGKGGPL